MLPLKGLKVVDLTNWIMGPVCAATLGDWGAEVIKIEPPETGDNYRWYLPTAGVDDALTVSLFDMVNRNKRGMAIDLKQSEGRDIIYKLIVDADILVTNVRKEALASLGMDYARLSAMNPRLIYAHASGFGDKGPDAEKPGYDASAFWARSGQMAELAEEGAEPVQQATVGIGDQASGLVLFGGVLLALYHRERTGQGQQVDLSLLGMGSWTVAGALQFLLSGGERPPKVPRKESPAPLANFYKAKDGKWLYLVCAPPDHYWAPLCRALGREELENDSRFNTFEVRIENSVELISILDDVFATKTRDEWAGLLDQHGVIWTHIPGSFEEVADDPQLQANDYITTVDHPEYGPSKIVNTPIHLNGKAPSIRMMAPEIGQHTEEVLLDLGYTWEDIGKLQEKGIIP